MSIKKRANVLTFQLPNVLLTLLFLTACVVAPPPAPLTSTFVSANRYTPDEGPAIAGPPAMAPTAYTYRVVHAYPHDPQAFTQGLDFEAGVLYEGTGLRGGRSTLRQVALETGTVRHAIALPPKFFGEGVTVYGTKIVQLTWQSHVGFVYDVAQAFESAPAFAPQQTFQYPTEGWGITHDGKRLIMSDGTSTLHFLNPQTFEETHRIVVHDQNTPVVRLNELEYIHGEIFANVWQTDRIARIEPRTGQVTGWINLEGLLSAEDRAQPVDVLNGIAYAAPDAHPAPTALSGPALPGRLFVTGKLWPKLFEIQVIPAAAAP